MRLISSAVMFFHTISRDLRLTRLGAPLGWWTRSYYRYRLDARAGRPPAAVEVALTVNGVSVKVFVTSMHLGTLAGVFLDAEYDVRAHLPFVPATILDLGANAGMGTAYLHALYPAAKFVCVEPDPRNLPLLEKTLAANKVTAHVVTAAVASSPGRLKLRTGENPTCSALETSPMHDLGGTVDVDCVSVPDLLARAGWAGVDLVKMDIEGTEIELLGKNNEWLANVRAIVLEIHPNTSSEEIGEFLRPYGFILTRTGHGMEPVYLARRSEPAP